MKFPLHFDFFGSEISFHLLMEFFAFFIGIRVYYCLKKRQKNDDISSMNRLWIMLGAMIGALIGSRLIAALETPSLLKNYTFIQLYGNKTVLGGFLFGIFGVELTKFFIKEKHSSGDLYVIPIIIALIIGRIGCFSMGVFEPTFGIPTSFVFGMDLGDGILRHPIMLYEISFLLILLFLTLINPFQFKSGTLFKIFILSYFTFRFLVEFIKPYESLFLNLSIIHWCGIFIWIYYISLSKINR